MLAAFRSRNYTLFWIGSFVSNVGTWMQTVALGWLIYEMTGSASWLGTVSFAANAPMLLFEPPAAKALMAKVPLVSVVEPR